MKKIVSSLLSLTMLLSLSVIGIASISATSDIVGGPEMVSGIIGDTDRSGRVDVKDATLIQKHSASLVVLEKPPLVYSDVNGDNSVNVVDATNVQKYTANISVNEVVGTTVEYPVEWVNDWENGKPSKDVSEYLVTSLPSKVAIRVQDSTSGEFTGATVGIYADRDWTKEPLDVITTTSSKEFVESNKKFLPGQYFVKLMIPSTGYAINSSPYVLNVFETTKENKVVIMTISTEKGASVGVECIDKNTKVPVSGGVYGIYAYPDAESGTNPLLTKVTVDADGKAAFDILVSGECYIRQLEAPDGYAVDNNTYNLVPDSDNSEKGVPTYLTISETPLE